MTRESKTHIDHPRLIFRETFQDEQSVRRNGGIPTDVTFSNGIATFNGTSSKIVYPQSVLSGDFTIRIKTTLTAATWGHIIGFNADNYIRFNNSRVIMGVALGGINSIMNFSSDFSSGEIVLVRDGLNVYGYLDGILEDSELEASAPDFTWENIGFFSTNYYNGDLDLIEIYNYALSQEEILNFFRGKRFHELTGQTEIINVSAQSGSIIDRWGNTLTNTATTVVKDGDVRCMKFDGATSKVDCGDPDALIGDKTISAWCLAKSYGETSLGKIIDNGELLVYIGSGYRLNVRSSTGVTAVSNINFFEFNKWFFVTVIRESDGTVSHYVNGIDETSTSNSDTPVAGSTNLIIGANNAGNTTWDGYINDVRIIDGLLTAEQISQLFSNERSQYRI
jgi:hypothetical protein